MTVSLFISLCNLCLISSMSVNTHAILANKLLALSKVKTWEHFERLSLLENKVPLEGGGHFSFPLKIIKIWRVAGHEQNDQGGITKAYWICAEDPKNGNSICSTQFYPLIPNHSAVLLCTMKRLIWLNPFINDKINSSTFESHSAYRIWEFMVSLLLSWMGLSLSLVVTDKAAFEVRLSQ